jgi:hypothetical protein
MGCQANAIGDLEKSPCICHECLGHCLQDVDINDDALGKYDEVWGGNALLWHINNMGTMNWNIKALDVGLLGYV